MSGFATGGGVEPAPGAPVGGNGALGGGRDGKVIRTVSRASVVLSAGGGVTAMRPVSFLGSVGSAMKRSRISLEIA
jgi:hypothetical protein